MEHDALLAAFREQEAAYGTRWVEPCARREPARAGAGAGAGAGARP